MHGLLRLRMSVVGTLALFFVALCSPAIGQSFFEEVGEELGIVDGLPNGCDIKWYDYEGDGDQDAFVSHRFGSLIYLFRNDGGQFTRLDDFGFPSNWDQGLAGPMDFDHDGDVDLYCRCYHSPSPMMVYEGGRFIDRTYELSLPWETGNRGTLWVDFDRDGWMDLLWGHYISGFHLYKNMGGGAFLDITSSSLLPPLNDFSELAEADIDRDGDVDLFMTRTSGDDHFYLNLGGGIFVDATGEAGLDLACGRMDCKWVDFNHDFYPDLLTQGTDRHTIWHNDRDGTFTEMRVHGTETDFGGEAWGATYSVADFDRDKDYDIYTVRPGGCGGSRAPNQFFIMDSIAGLDIWFHNVASDWGMAFEANGSSTVADMDGDGDLDLTVSVTDDVVKVFRNNIISGSYLQVRVLGPNGEQDRWHTRIEMSPHGEETPLAVSELNTSNVGRNGLINYFVVDDNGHYDLRIYFPCGVEMGPEDFAALSDVVPAQVNHQLTVYMSEFVEAGEPRAILPTGFRLEAPFPNPFNAVTSIRYSVPRAASVTLIAYNIVGQRVAEIVHGAVSAGAHRAEWNASEHAAGLYLLELQMDGQRAFQKVVLLK